MSRTLYGPGLLGGMRRLTDSAIDVVAPRWALNRRLARAATSELLNYEAAQRRRTRRRQHASSADVDLLQDLPELRRNSRAMCRDDSTGKAIVKVFLDNVVGTGIVPQSLAKPETTGLTDSQARDWNRACEQVFEEWATDQADATEHSSFYSLQRQVLRSMVVDGECLVKRTSVDPAQETWRLLASSIESVDLDRLRDPPAASQADRELRGGVEIGPRGQPLAYWVLPYHPDERMLSRSSRRRNDPVRYTRWAGGLPLMLHVFDRERSGQNRGVPAMSASFGLVESLNDYIESEAVAARAASKICMFIRQTVSPVAGLIDQQPNGPDWHERLESGTIRYLNDGEEPFSFAPQRPGTQFEPFVVRLLKSICGSFGLPYELVSKDFGGMNYSSARVALLEAARGFEAMRQLLQEQFCQPWWRIVITEAVLRGLLPTPRGFAQNPRPFLETLWVPPMRGYVDPTKEIQASQMAVDANLSTPQAEAARNGQDAEQVLEQRARFLRQARETAKRHGLDEGALLPTPKAGAAAPPSAVQNEGEAEDDESEQDPDTAEHEEPASGDDDEEPENE